MKAQAQAYAQAQQIAAQTEMQKNQFMVQNQIQLEQQKGQIESNRMVQETQHKKELMLEEFKYNMQIKGLEVQGARSRESEKEDRKDERTKIQATQQSELIDQRQSGKPPKKFDSSSDAQGFDLGPVNLQ